MIQINDKMLREMKKLYIEGYGTKKISKKFNLAITTARNYLLKAGIKFRNASKDIISISQHNRFINLYLKGKSMKKIAQICNVSFSTVRRHLIKSNLDLKKRGNPSLITNRGYGKLSLEKAYILGVIGPGDGFIEYNSSNSQYKVALEAIDLEFVEYFKLCLEKIYGIKSKIETLKPRNFGINNTFRVRLGSKEVCNDLLSYEASFRENDWGVPLIIKNASKEIKAKYLQGFADSQGSVRSDFKQVILCNQNINGLKQIEKLLNDLEIKNISYDKKGILLCNRKNVEIFNELINFNIKRKKDSLQKLMGRYSIYKKSTEELAKLNPKIIEMRRNGLSYPRIAKELDISISAAWNHSKHIKEAVKLS